MPTRVKQFSRPRWWSDLRGTRQAPDLTPMPAEEAERARTRLAELENACGCTLGSAIAFTALAVYIAVLAFGPGLLSDSWWVSVAAGAMVFALAAGAGKTLGQIRARQQRDRLIDELHRRIATGRPEVLGGLRGAGRAGSL